MNKIKISQDNNWNNKENRRGILIDKETLGMEAQSFFGWRSVTKKYTSYYDRFSKLGSSDRDKLINYLIDNKGY